MTARSFGDVVAELSRAQKSSAGTPAYSRFVNRRIGRVLAAAAFLAGRTPNQVSLASGFCSLVGIVLIAAVRPSLPLALVVVMVLLVLGYGLDSADGQLARLRGGGSPLGEWLDHMIDSVKIVLLHSAVLVSFYRFDAFSNELLLLVPLAYVCMSSVLFFGLILIDQLRRRHGGQKPNERGDSVLKSLLIAPTDYGVLCLVFLTFAWPSVFIVLYGGLLAVNLLFLAAASAKWFREMAALQPAREEVRG